MDAAWSGPPRDTLGRVVPLQRFLARTDRAVIALEHVVAFPEGCVLTLHLAVRRGAPDDEHTDLRLGVRFPDGRRATTVEHPFPGWAPPTDRPEPPMLIAVGGESSSTRYHYDARRQLWLWPLPPATFGLVVEWPAAGIDLTSTTLDGTAVVQAAELAAPFWP